MFKLVSKNILLLVLIIFIGAVIRFYQLSKYPIQLSHDEVTQLYDAISIAQTSRDIYGNFLPVIFQSVHDFKPPFYTYLTNLTYLIMGDQEIIIRIPGALFGVLIIAAIYFFSLKFLKNQQIALLSAAITSFSSFEIFFSRKSFENGAGIFFLLLGFGCLFSFLDKKGQQIWLYLAAFFLSLGMYTYFSNAIFIPILLISFLFIFRKRFQSLAFKSLILPTILTIALIFPLFWVMLTNSDSRYRPQTVFITQDANLGQQIESSKLENLTLSKLFYYKTISDYSFTRYLSQLNLLYLFGNGLDLTNQGPIGVGPLLFLQLPFLILGIMYLLKRDQIMEEKKFIMVWILIGMMPSGLTFEPFSPHRSMMVFTMFNILSATGLYVFVGWVNNFRNSFIRVSIFSLGILLFLVNIIYFFHIYFVNYPFEKSQSLHWPFKQVAEFAWSKYPNFDAIIFDPLFGEAAPVIGTGAHYYLAYYGKYPPAKFQKEYRVGKKPREVIFDKFSIRKIDWGEDQKLQKTLLILSSWSIDPRILEKNRDKIIKTFYFYDHRPAFYAIRLD